MKPGALPGLLTLILGCLIARIITNAENMMGRPRILTPEEHVAAASLYRSGLSILNVAIRIGKPRATVRNALLRLGVTMREKHRPCSDFETRSKAHRTLAINEAAFDEITPEAAYWIGFLMADGNIGPRGTNSYKITLDLKSSDADHVRKFRDFLGSSHSIQIDSRCAYFSFVSTPLAIRLMSFGITPRKFKTAKVVGLEHNRDFWRGVVDGDGTIRIAKVGHRLYPRLQLVGSQPLITQFLAFVRTICPQCEANVLSHKSIFMGVLMGRFAHAVISYLYSDASRYLPRKQQIAAEIISSYAQSRLVSESLHQN